MKKVIGKKGDLHAFYNDDVECKYQVVEGVCDNPRYNCEYQNLELDEKGKADYVSCSKSNRKANPA